MPKRFFYSLCQKSFRSNDVCFPCLGHLLMQSARNGLLNLLNTHKRSRPTTLNRSLCDFRQDHNGLSDLFGSAMGSGLYKKG